MRRKSAYIRKPKKLTRCPDCNKKMIWFKQRFEYFWLCSAFPKCKISARDDKGNPKHNPINISFLDQLILIKPLIKDLNSKILVRLIMSRGNISNLPEKYIKKYHELIEPTLSSIVYVRCYRCSMVLDASISCDLGNDEYMCDWCWGH